MLLDLYNCFHKKNWCFLLPALFLLLCLSPYAEPYTKTWSLRLLNDLILLSIILTAGTRPYRILCGLLLTAPAIAFQWLPETEATHFVIALSLSLLYIYTFALTIDFILRAKIVGLNELCASVSLYLLMGLTWMTFYLIVEQLAPGSFKMAEEKTANWANLLYYSFVTLTTLGYGDIVPVSMWARTLAIVEAIAGGLVA